MVFKILYSLVGEKIKYKDFKNTSYCNSKICTESCNSISVQLPFCSLADFLPWLATSHCMQENPPIDVHLLSGFWNNFKDHSWVTEKVLGKQAAFSMPQQALWRGSYKRHHFKHWGPNYHFWPCACISLTKLKRVGPPGADSPPPSSLYASRRQVEIIWTSNIPLSSPLGQASDTAKTYQFYLM